MTDNGRAPAGQVPTRTRERLAIDGGDPVRRDYLVFGQPVILQPEIDEVVDTLRSRWIGTGPKVARFEAMFAETVNSPHARAVSSCTAGLHLALKVAGIGAGDEVITTPLTFAATVNAILHVGATPVLADVDPVRQTLDPAAAAEAVTYRTKAILPVDMAGRPCDLDALGELAKRHGLLVVEDAAHSLGAEWRGRPVGSIADLTVFSFYATKNITTAEGGMVTTDNEAWASDIELYALHGMSHGAWRRYSDEGHAHYGVLVPGFKYNMTDLAASLGLHQLPRLTSWRRRREEIWNFYDANLSDLPLCLPSPQDEGTVHARHLYTVLVGHPVGPSRDWVLQALHCEGIGTGIHFLAIHDQPYYRENLPYGPGDFPHAEDIGRRTLSLPLSPGLSDSDVEDVVRAVRKVVLASP